MGVACFMVEHVMDCWVENIGPRVGAMVWRNHSSKAYDPAPTSAPHLAVMTPAGLACLDCYSDRPPHAHWARTGTPPAVTVSPSLDVNPGGVPHWHGHLIDGHLV